MRANISVHAESAGSGVVSVAASATAPSSGNPSALFVALTEDKLTSNVSAGENRGVTLSHDHVVREWLGPIALNGDHVDFRQAVTTRPSWNAGQLGIAGFVQDLRAGQVLQRSVHRNVFGHEDERRSAAQTLTQGVGAAL